MTTNSQSTKSALAKQVEVGSFSNRTVVAIAVVVWIVSFFFIAWAPIFFALAFVLYLFYLVLTAVSPGTLTLAQRLVNTWRFLWDFVVDLYKSNMTMLFDLFSYHNTHSCLMIAVPIADLTEAEVALLSHRITLTPGTLSCLVDVEAKVLLVHTMYKAATNEDILSLRMPIDILKGKA